MSTSVPVYRIIIEDDQHPDLSWLEQAHYDPASLEFGGPCYRNAEDMAAERNPIDPDEYRNPDNHVTYSVLLQRQCAECGDWSTVNALGNVDFYGPDDNYPATGTYDVGDASLGDYLRELVDNMMQDAASN